MNETDKRWRLFDEIHAERLRQEAKWGPQSHPMIPPLYTERAKDATSPEAAGFAACWHYGLPSEADAKARCDARFRTGGGTYTDIAVEELVEFIDACALHGETSDKARAELVQTAAVVVAMIECIDRKRAEAALGAAINRLDAKRETP